MAKNKQERQQEILRLITQQQIRRQEDLVQQLNELGWQVTQATVSRDIADMQLVKVPLSEGGFTYATMSHDDYRSQLRHILHEATTHYTVQGNMVMIKVSPGSGPALKIALEEVNVPEMFGIIGDDTGVLLILKDAVDASHFMNQMMDDRD
ncbi:arginine repressor [Weissella tructae]|uniref:Arginine repressor n=1 Tax=Weissella tructae TaxID=887702 RepID=A0ABM5QUJ7_9LACO|nr:MULTISPECIES: arginine catabolic regulator [Weissella]AIG65840.1 Arginine repressor [Weissella tructae]AIM64554.1 Arginine repressor [Weissella ceti]ELA07211.1 arginine catabolic regulator [Weissella ceti NC36]QVV90999.1 arginine catabolic regulator [Weissella tructae]